MPHFNYRSLALASAAFLGSALGASAQFVDLLTEAPVTLQVTVQNTVTTTTPTAITTTNAVTKLTNIQVLQELATAGTIPNNPPTGWTLVAVRNAPSDLAFVDAGFALYATNGSSRIAVPTEKFAAAAYASVAKYTEKNQGRYILSSSGMVTNHVAYAYSPTFSVGSNKYVITDSETAGFAKVSFTTKNLSDSYEIFFYAINSVSVTTQGGFSGTVAQGLASPEANTGLFSLTITVGTPKLVPATRYPDVDPSNPDGLDFSIFF